MRLLLLLLPFLVSCSMEKKCAKAAEKCSQYWVQKGPDTLRITDTLKIPGAQVTHTFDCDTIHDTVTIEKGRATLKLWKDSTGRLNADCDCPDTSVEVEKLVIRIPTPGSKVAVTPPWLPYATFGTFIFAFLVGYHFRRIYSKETKNNLNLPQK